MSNRPDSFMPFYVGDYLRDTLALTRDQHGAYCLLLMAYWGNGGPLPNDDEALGSIAKATPAEWKKLRPVMLRYFSEDNKVWHQKRADKEITRSAEKYSARKDAGARGNAKRWGSQTDRKTIANLSQCDPNAIPMRSQPHLLSSSSKKESKARAAARVEPAAPPAANQPDWTEGHDRWCSFKAKFAPGPWSLWFQRCRLNGSELSLIAPSTFERDEIGKRYYTALAAHFGEPVTIKVADGASYAPD